MLVSTVVGVVYHIPHEIAYCMAADEGFGVPSVAARTPSRWHLPAWYGNPELRRLWIAG